MVSGLLYWKKIKKSSSLRTNSIFDSGDFVVLSLFYSRERIHSWWPWEKGQLQGMETDPPISGHHGKGRYIERLCDDYFALKGDLIITAMERMIKLSLSSSSSSSSKDLSFSYFWKGLLLREVFFLKLLLFLGINPSIMPTTEKEDISNGCAMIISRWKKI